MLNIRRIKDNSNREYRFMEDLLVESFPVNEYRDISEQRYITETEEGFHCCVIEEDTNLIGLITYWLLGNICFIEHFATVPNLRNKGYGRLILEMVQLKITNPIILEVEMPENEMAVRRIEFYKRNNFKILECDYFQPSYRQDGNALPMLLMSNKLLVQPEYNRIISHIHNSVYLESWAAAKLMPQ